MCVMSRQALPTAASLGTSSSSSPLFLGSPFISHNSDPAALSAAHASCLASLMTIHATCLASLAATFSCSVTALDNLTLAAPNSRHAASALHFASSALFFSFATLTSSASRSAASETRFVTLPTMFRVSFIPALHLAVTCPWLPSMSWPGSSVRTPISSGTSCISWKLLSIPFVDTNS
ncbi:hypothetical protein F5888DRAFT_1657700 [Russula emetica]|nr:hypothetical protein F5888DRAFT_1657700 [Russula emetica]